MNYNKRLNQSLLKKKEASLLAKWNEINENNEDPKILSHDNRKGNVIDGEEEEY